MQISMKKNEPSPCNLESQDNKQMKSPVLRTIQASVWDRHIMPILCVNFNAWQFLFYFFIYFFGSWISLHCLHEVFYGYTGAHFIYTTPTPHSVLVLQGCFSQKLAPKDLFSQTLHSKWLLGPNFMIPINYRALCTLVRWNIWL